MARRPPSAYTDRLLIVVTAANRTAARQQAQRIDPQGGGDTFTHGLSPTGAEPVTHYWASWQMLPDDATTLTGFLAGVGAAPNRPRVFTGDRAADPDGVLAELGLQRVQPPTSP